MPKNNNENLLYSTFDQMIMKTEIKIEEKI